MFNILTFSGKATTKWNPEGWNASAWHSSSNYFEFSNDTIEAVWSLNVHTFTVPSKLQVATNAFLMQTSKPVIYYKLKKKTIKT